MYQLVAENLEKKKQPGGLEPFYFRELHEQWERLEEEEKIDIVKNNSPEVVAEMLLLMMGQPGDNTQIQNRYKYGVFEMVLRHNPQVLALPTEKKEPVWVEAVTRFNLHQDGSMEKAMRALRPVIFEEHEAELWHEKYEELIRRMRGY